MTTRRRLLQALLCTAMAPALAADAKPDVAIVLARLDLAAGKVSDVTNITPGKGANFQPVTVTLNPGGS